MSCMLCKTTVRFTDVCDNWLTRVSVSGSNKDQKGHVRQFEVSDRDADGRFRTIMCQELLLLE